MKNPIRRMYLLIFVFVLILATSAFTCDGGASISGNSGTSNPTGAVAAPCLFNCD